MPEPREMISVDHLTKRYGPHTAVNDISFSVDKGQVLGFLGPNGAGKSTTMKILTTFLSPTAGRARIAGLDVWDHPLEVRRKIGYLPEDTPLYKDMAIAEYLGTKLSARMVGWAMNACPPDVPAQRVVNRNGLLTGKHHFPEPHLMQQMLEAEGVTVVDDKIVDLEKHFWHPRILDSLRD